MKVQVDFKVTFLEGEDKGKTTEFNRVYDTQQEYCELGVVERLRIMWSFLHSLDQIPDKETCLKKKQA